jgi:hypothetical protein
MQKLKRFLTFISVLPVPEMPTVEENIWKVCVRSRLGYLSDSVRKTVMTTSVYIHIH